MKLYLWFSADSYNCRFICVRIVVNKQTEFFFHQMGSMTNKMHQISCRPGLCPGPRWGSPLWGSPLDAYGVSFSAPSAPHPEPPCYTLPL